MSLHVIQLGQLARFWQDYYRLCWRILRCSAAVSRLPTRKRNWPWTRWNSTWRMKFSGELRKLLNYRLFISLTPFLCRELFPDLVIEIQERLEKLNEIKKQNEKDASNRSAETNQVDSSSNNGTAYNLFTNVIILVMFGIFICIVKKIYESGEQE